MGRLPEQTMANLQTVAGMRQQYESTSNSLRSEQDRLALLDRQIQQMRQGAQSAPAGPTGAPSSPRQRVVAPGKGLKARICRAIASDDARQSMRASALAIFAA